MFGLVRRGDSRFPLFFPLSTYPFGVRDCKQTRCDCLGNAARGKDIRIRSFVPLCCSLSRFILINFLYYLSLKLSSHGDM
jgi:hypothetical protein